MLREFAANEHQVKNLQPGRGHRRCFVAGVERSTSALESVAEASNEQCSLGNLTKSPGGAAKIARKESLKSKGPQINGRVIC